MTPGQRAAIKARRQAEVERAIDRYTTKLAADAPPLSDRQRARLAAIFGTVNGGDHGAG